MIYLNPQQVRAKLEALDADVKQIGQAGFTRRVPTEVGVQLANIEAATAAALKGLREGAPEAFNK